MGRRWPSLNRGDLGRRGRAVTTGQGQPARGERGSQATRQRLKSRRCGADSRAGQSGRGQGRMRPNEADRDLRQVEDGSIPAQLTEQDIQQRRGSWADSGGHGQGRARSWSGAAWRRRRGRAGQEAGVTGRTDGDGSRVGSDAVEIRKTSSCRMRRAEPDEAARQRSAASSGRRSDGKETEKRHELQHAGTLTWALIPCHE
jgi:hypothetical protein